MLIHSNRYDAVIKKGRVMHSGMRLDVLCNIDLKSSTIAAITEREIRGVVAIHAAAHVNSIYI